MREIKFRAWDDDRKKMIHKFYMFKKHPTPSLFQTEEGNIICGSYQTNQDWHEPKLMQFTGLKDKIGKEIYQSDILKTGTDKNMVVTWSNRFASFCLEREGWAFQHWFGEACNPEDCEVIGNIYENPDLLK